VIAIQCSERNGALVARVQIATAHEIMLISNQGTLVRTRAAEVARVGRNTQGVTLIRLPAEEALVWRRAYRGVEWRRGREARRLKIPVDDSCSSPEPAN
jgi:DNA gyrase/topoisomerase IV subunit A